MPGILEEKGFSKDQVYRRLMQHAATLWNVQGADIDSFDPLVGLLFGAFAKEVEKMGHQVASSQTRVLHRLSQLLVPDVQTGPLPAHAVMQAFPVEPVHVSKPDDQFCLRGYEKAEGKDLYFTPVLPLPLYDGDVRYVAFGRQICTADPARRETVLQSAAGERLEGLWLGLRLHESIKSLPTLTFYLEWPEAPNGERLPHTMRFSRWFLADEPREVTGGLPLTGALPGLSGLPEDYREQIRAFYENQFITVHTGGALPRQTYPAAFSTVFEAPALARLDEELVWLRVAFPSGMPATAAESIRFRFNCFPVMNRRRHQFSYRLQPMFNIVPVEQEDLFYCVDRVVDTQGDTYAAQSTPDYRRQPEKTYFLRQEGVGRFDERDATELLSHLTDLLRDESAAFAALGRDYLSGEVKELNQIVTRFAQYLAQFSASSGRGKPFLFLKAPATGDTVFVHYWSTLGALASRVPATTPVEAYASADYARGTSLLVTATVGGRDALSENEQLKTFRSALLSRGRLVTAEDIKAFCYAELGDAAEQVEVRKGVAVSEEPGGGLVRTLEVTVWPSKNGAAYDWISVGDDLKNQLSARSSFGLPFQVIVVK